MFWEYLFGQLLLMVLKYGSRYDRFWGVRLSLMSLVFELVSKRYNAFLSD